MGFLLGYSKKEITPQVPISLAGYRPLREANAIHDSLYLRCIVIKNEQTEETTAIISYDLIGVDHLIIDRIKKLLKEENIEIHHFVLSATHTHSGPAGVLNTMRGPLKDMSDFFGAPQMSLINHIAQITLNALKESLDTLQSFRIELVQTTFNNIGSIRDDKSSRTDPHIFLVRFLLEDAKQLLLYHFACQASVLGESNNKLSADFPGAVLMHNRTEEMIMFLNGNAGNINTKTFTKSDTYEQNSEFGRQLAYEMGILMKHPDYIGELFEFEVRKFQIELKRKQVETFNNLKETFPISYQIIRFNDRTLITLPVEMTSEVMEDMKESHQVECICYTNGYDLILTSQESFDLKRYEALMSPFQKGEAERLIHHIAQNI